MRADLLHLTDDDLATFANRGIVRRARAEADDQTLTFDINEDSDGKLTVGWSDGAVCTFPASGTLHQAVCTCPATTVCRHTIRSVFAYQKSNQSNGMEETERAAPTPWNPGGMTDELLAGFISAKEMDQARKSFEAGCVAEVAVGIRPTAYFHDLSLSLRFLVKDDPRYVHCDCAAPSPCRHVAAAVWAFRKLPVGHSAGIIAIEKPVAVETALFDDLESGLAGLFESGFSNIGKSEEGLLRRLANRCRAADLVWPADVLHELFLEHDRYAGHDARFDAGTVADLVAEACVRVNAVQSGNNAVPQLFIRGDASERPTDIGTARMIGLGCGATPQRGGTVVTTYFQNADSGAVTVIRRNFPDPTEDGATPRSFLELGRTAALKGATFAALGAGQAVVKGGKRLPDGSFVVGRAQAAVSPQNFAWESLRAPIFHESFGEIRERLRNRPPRMLRPRRLAGNLMVCPLVGVVGSRFDSARQEIQAVVRDMDGETALMVHPFTLRGASGCERLLAALHRAPEAIRFVSGEAKIRNGELEIAPLAVVFQGETAKYAVQPWVDGGEAAASPRAPSNMTESAPSDPVADFIDRLTVALSELLHSGIAGADDHALRAWRALTDDTAALGLHRLRPPVAFIADTVEGKTRRLTADAERTARAARAALKLNALIRFEADFPSS